MHKQTSQDNRQLAPDAVICFANYAAFPSGHALSSQQVDSRMALWCKEGCGIIRVNGIQHEFHPGDYLFLPWKHRIDYQADRQKPFLLAGIHIVPHHDRSKPVEFSVAHTSTSPLSNCPWRCDVDLTPLEGIISFRLTEESPLWLLSEYIVQLYITRDWQEVRMRELAGSLLNEINRTFQSMPRTQNRRSEADFAILTEYLRTNLARPLTVDDLAQCLDCSESTVGRLIRLHIGLSPVNWINQTRIHKARSLLSTTRLPVARIGASVGIHDPFYFSKLFKKWTGESPLAYRKHTPML